MLVASQLLAGLGVASGVAVGGLLAEELSGTVVVAGLAQTSSVLGAGLWAIPLARLAGRRGRRWGLGCGYALAVAGCLLVLGSAALESVVLLFVGLAAFGASTAAGLQARFAAAELTTAAYRARALSVVLWATTLGSVLGPNLSEVGARLGERLGIEPLSGPYLFSVVAFTAAALTVAVGLAPRPVSTAAGLPAPASPVEQLRFGAALRLGLANPLTRLAVVAITCSHTVMVGVMVMTPLHMGHLGFSLDLVGLVISIHIFGMYGASPVMGWLTDKISAVGVLLVGVVVLAAALVLAALADEPSMLVISLALGLLGLGWSAGMIGGSALLAGSVAPEAKVSVQGAADAVMNVAAAASSAVSGLVLGWAGYPGLAAVAAVVLAPMAVLAVLSAVRPSAGPGGGAPASDRPQRSRV
ncbi:Predicted arabinose efflux permease, MFS family [Friedmanniella luteola]|uniref:Predicted arabinose efflux permease, MFS family n=1 Tax=Friedmanniella luteola TaxID=546871 RepID=A0A1H1SNL0_9ACTN|nr:Predicted arabinose efflux permease, MFS family [Friedmanniella luteola]